VKRCVSTGLWSTSHGPCRSPRKRSELTWQNSLWKKTWSAACSARALGAFVSSQPGPCQPGYATPSWFHAKAAPRRRARATSRSAFDGIVDEPR
jgi:hypothetical protein